ncbi:MAG: acyl-CoA thioesterase [Sinobacterium sp.]|nr:acyl-CoA thioesterase [Sinobacterium sp.]
MNDIDLNPTPTGDLAIQTVAMPKDTNASGDIFGGWLVSQMDIAGAISASREAGGKVATVAIEGMSFMVPVKVGSLITCYTEVRSLGRSSIQIQVEVWMDSLSGKGNIQKVTEGTFVFVAIDDSGNTRAL